LTEAIAKIPRSLSALRNLVAAARANPPDGLVVIDFPEINFRLARRLKTLGIRVVFYITPQLWAWRPGRLETIRQLADRVLVIFPFEEAMYREAGVPVEFVGHPLVDVPRDPGEGQRLLRGIGLSPEAPTVAVLPGSRPNEVARILPDLVAACRRIQRRVPAAQFVIARAPSLDDSLFDVVRRERLSPALVVERQTDAALAAADVALTASGTATVQTALHDTPMVVVYRLSPTTYRLGRRFVKVDMFAMVNLIAGERIVPELIQDAFTPEAVADEAVSMLTDPGRAADIRRGLALVRGRLGRPGASRRAAEAILRVVARDPEPSARPLAGG
jgi:lipid-A-disaccharide synthase